MRAEQAERTDIPAGNEKSSGDVFSLSVGKYVVRACSAKTDGQISSEKQGILAESGTFIENFVGRVFAV